MANRADDSTRNALPFGRVIGATRTSGGAGEKKPRAQCPQIRWAWRVLSQPSP